MSFTEQFDATPMEEQPDLVVKKRLELVVTDLDKYVPIPIAIPVMSRVAQAPTKYRLGWAVGIPGKQEDENGKPARGGLSLGFPDEDTAKDFCFMMNNANYLRKMEELSEYKS